MSDSSRQTDALASKIKKGKPPTSDNCQNRKSATQHSKKNNHTRSPHPLFNTYKEFINHTSDEPDPCLPLVMNYLMSFDASRSMEQTRRVLTPLQWHFVLTTAEKMAATVPERHERTLFIAATLFSMYLRVSDVCGRVNWQPMMGSFKADHDGNWWFHLIGKGDKAAKVAVRPEYIDRYLKRYRRFMGLSELPLPNEQTPLIATLSGRPGLSTRMVHSIIQELFDRAVDEMVSEGRQSGEIEALQLASTHWLRHTAATLDAPWRDAKDLQMDLRHNNLATTQDIYYSSYEDKRSFSLRKLGLRNRD